MNHLRIYSVLQCCVAGSRGMGGGASRGGQADWAERCPLCGAPIVDAPRVRLYVEFFDAVLQNHEVRRRSSARV